MKTKLTYEKLQEYNRITSWLHSRRYSHVIDEFRRCLLTFPQRPIRILDIGCGTAKLYEMLDGIAQIEYHGCEILPEFINEAMRRYGDRPNFFLHSESIMKDGVSLDDWDIVVALETLEHIPEHDVVRLVENIAKQHAGLFIASVPVEIGPALFLKNFGAFVCRYPRYKEYTWWQTLMASAFLLDCLPPHGTSHMGFDWRWLTQTVRHNMHIIRFRKLPLRWLPACFSSSVFLVAKSRALSSACNP